MFEVTLAMVIVIVVQCGTLGTGTQYSCRANILIDSVRRWWNYCRAVHMGFPALDIEVNVAGAKRMQTLQRTV